MRLWLHKKNKESTNILLKKFTWETSEARKNPQVEKDIAKNCNVVVFNEYNDDGLQGGMEKRLWWKKEGANRKGKKRQRKGT